MHSQEYLDYLQSDHWQALKDALLRLKPRECEVCHSTEVVDAHHVVYRDLYSVTPADLRWVCRVCHERIHEMLDARRFVYRSFCPEVRWEATLAALEGRPDPVLQAKKTKAKPQKKRRRRSKKDVSGHGVGRKVRVRDPWANLPMTKTKPRVEDLSRMPSSQFLELERTRGRKSSKVRNSAARREDRRRRQKSFPG